MPKYIKFYEEYTQSQRLTKETQLTPLQQFVQYLDKICASKKPLVNDRPYEDYISEKVWQSAYKIFDEGDNFDKYEFYWRFLNTFDPDDETIWFTEKLKEVEEDLEIDKLIMSFSESMGGEDIEDFLTELGILELKKSKEEYFRETVENSDLFHVLNNLDSDELVPIFRSVVYHADDTGSYLNEALNYSSLGVCWSYDPNKAEPHCGYSSKKTALEIVYHAKTPFKSIDWPMTLMVNAWGQKEEKEVRIKDGGLIQVEEIHICDESEKIKPIVVKA
jgi:hypothetical protein